MCRTFECKLTFLWRKLEFYTRVHKKDPFCCSLYHYDHITIALMLQTQYRIVLSNFLKKQYFFSIPTLGKVWSMFSTCTGVIKLISFNFYCKYFPQIYLSVSSEKPRIVPMSKVKTFTWGGREGHICRDLQTRL